MSRSTSTATKRTALADSSIRIGADRDADRPFDNLGEQLQAIAGHFGASVAVDRRLYSAASGASATSGPDGGFLIQKNFGRELLDATLAGGEILSRCDTFEVGPSGDGAEIAYIDETSRSTGQRWGGVQIYRLPEAETVAAKKPRFGLWAASLEDLMGLAYATDRLVADAPALAKEFSAGFQSEFQFVSEDEAVRGSGAGQMLGILNAPGTITVAKEVGQLAGTIVAENIGKMWSHVHPRSRKTGAWFYNTECEPQLDQLQIGVAASDQLTYPAELPYGLLKGRPCIPIEQASGLGDLGDFFFADFAAYRVLTKGGTQTSESIHVRFENTERAFRWWTRINGGPKDKAPLTPYKATDPTLRLSPFVVLEAR